MCLPLWLFRFGCHSGNILSTVLVSHKVLLPRVVHTSKCGTPVAFFSYAPPLACRGRSGETATFLLAATLLRISATHTKNFDCCWRRQQRQRVVLATIKNSLLLHHQRRGVATISNNMNNGLKITATNNAEKRKKERKENERPRLICMARWSKRHDSAVSINACDSGRVQMSSSVADLVDASGGGCASCREKLFDGSEIADVYHTAQLEDDEKGETRIKNNREQVDYGVSLEYSVAAALPAQPSFSTSAVDSGRHNHSDDSLVYNIFTHRVVRCTAASVRALAVLGIGVQQDTQELAVVDPSTLLDLRAKLVSQSIGWPTSWRSALFKQLEYILRTKSEQDTVEEVGRFLRIHYERVKIRRNVGVVANGDGAATPASSGASDDVTTTDRSMSLQERLFTYQDLNEEQQRVVDFVLEGHNTYIGGGAGTGKSLLLRVIKQKLVNHGLSVAMTATTGIAAMRIDGVTLHHCFGINVYDECTRRKELQAFDVIIVDEVSMLSKELFESFEYQMRRANGVDLPFGGVQVILSGDFLQLGAIAATSLVHSALFRRYFAMLKLQHVMRQSENNLFVWQLQELRRGLVPHNLQDTVTFLSPSECVKMMKSGGDGTVRLLPTNQQVDAVNQAELEKLPGELVEFPAQLCPPTLSGRWTATYILAVQYGDTNSVDSKKLLTALEHYVLEFVKKVPHASTITLSLFGQRHLVLYKLFVDAFGLRVRIPQEMNDKDEQDLASHLRDLETWLPAVGLGLCLKEIVDSPNGLHTDVDEYTLAQYAKNSPMMAPIRLKKGAKVMLRTNLSSAFVNGSLGVVIGFKELRKEHLPRFFMNSARLEAIESYTEYLQYECGFPVALAPEVDFGGGRIVVVPPTMFCVGGLSNTNHYQMGIVALPLSLAYAFTVHKVQGLTLVGRVHLQLSRMWPCEHLLYVAMSRVRNPEQLTVSHFHRDLVKCATECLLFDESLPPVGRVRLLPHFFQATWRRNPHRRKAALRQKKVLEARKKGTTNQQKSKTPRQIRRSSAVI